MFTIMYSVDSTNGKFLTVDSLYNRATFSSTKPEFMKTKKKKDNDDNADNNKDSTEHENNFVEKIQKVNLFDKRKNDKELYRQIINDTLELCEEEIITPYVSKIFALSDVNNAVKFIKGKTCTGKVLIDINMKVEKDKNNKDNDDDDEDKKKNKD